ncbi:unnamed protein product [Camellia sinensis]
MQRKVAGSESSSSQNQTEDKPTALPPMISIKSIDNNNNFVLPRRLSIGGQSIRDGRVLNSRVCGVRIRASMVDSYESSSNFVKRMEKAWIISQAGKFGGCSGTALINLFVGSLILPGIVNQGPLLALLVTQMGMLNANGVVVQVSLFLVTTCFAKYHPETAVVLFVLGRDQHAVLIVRERAFVQSGWESLLFLSRSANAWFSRPLKYM